MRVSLLRAAILLVWLCAQAGLAHAQSPVTLAGVTVAPTSVVGGASATGTLILSAPAGLLPLVVSLASSDPIVAVVPPIVPILTGVRTQSFTIATRAVDAARLVTISATLAGGTVSASLQVLPETSSVAPLPVPGPAVGDLVLGPGPTDTGPLGDPRPAGVHAGSGETVLAKAPGFFIAVPEDVDRDDRAIRQIIAEQALLVADAAGTALLRLDGDRSQVLLDPTARDPVDQVGIARLLRVETNRAGATALLALRADNQRGIYRLEQGRLTRLALLADERDQELVDPVPDELTISDSGQIAYVARSAAGGLTVFRTAGATSGVPVSLDALLRGVKVVRISNLQSSPTGELVFLVSRSSPDGSPAQAVLRVTGVGPTIVAQSGQVAERGWGAGVTMQLGFLRRPRIGADGTVVFLSVSDSSPTFGNYFVVRPGRPRPEPLLPGSDWSIDLEPSDFDEEVAADGTIALRATPQSTMVPSLYLIGPDGTLSTLGVGRLLPQGRPFFGSASRLFFLAADPELPRDADGQLRVGLYRSRLTNGRPVGLPEKVAVYGQAIPGKPGAQVLAVIQPPTPTLQDLAVEVQFGEASPGAVSTTGYFLVPLDGSLSADGRLVAEEGAPVAGVNRLALLRDLSYRADGTVVFGGLKPGASPLVATMSPAATASRARTQSGPRAPISPLLTTGDSLGEGRQLKSVLGPPLALGPDRQLLAARFSQDGGGLGEGLFTIDQRKQVQAVAVTGNHTRVAGAAFSGFADVVSPSSAPPPDCSIFSTTANPRSVGLPSVSADTSSVNVVFKARLASSEGSGSGLFQWTGADLLPLALENSPLGVLPTDRPPYELLRWAAGKSGSAFLMARSPGFLPGPSRLFQRMADRLVPVVVPGQTPVRGATPLTELSDFVVTGDGSIFVHGAAAGRPGVFRATAAELVPLVLEEQPLPPLADGRASEVQGLHFGRRFGLMPDSKRGPLLFRAEVEGAGSVRRGLFRLHPQRGLETLLIEGIGVAGARSLTVDKLGDSLDQQTVDGTTVFTSYSTKGGWVLYRVHANREKTTVTTEAIAQEARGTLGAGVPRFATLDPSLLLDLPCHSGPVFSLNEQGGVALLASSGQQWGLYLFPAP